MKSLLILDDMEEYLLSLKNALKKEFDVTTVSTLNQAKDVMSAEFDICLVDIRLSEEDDTNKDGLVFLEWEKLNFQETPVIMMSAYQDFDAAVGSLNMGASYFLKKPVNLKELKSLLHLFAEEKERSREETEKLRQRFQEKKDE